MGRVRAATVNALREAKKGSVEQAKALARVVRQLDNDTAGMAAKELRELLLAEHGLDLREDVINRSRYIGRLLFALDPRRGDPPVLASVDDAETLYLLQRLHETKGTPHDTLLSTLAMYQAGGLSPKALRQRMKDALSREAGRPTSEARATWRQPLMRVSGDVCDKINLGFSAFAEAQGVTQQQAAELLADLLTGGLAKLPSDVQERLDAALAAHVGRMNMKPEAAVLGLADLLEHLPELHWVNLYRAVT